MNKEKVTEKYLLSRFEAAIRKIKSDETETGFSVHSSNGWHFPSDD